jgi:hypothetical protein
MMTAASNLEPDSVARSATAEEGPAGRRVANSVVAALVPPGRSARPEKASPIPLPGLHSFQPDSSVVFGFGRLDGSGAVPARAVLKALNWRPGRGIAFRVEAGVVLVVTSRQSSVRVPAKGNLVVPALVRHRCRMHGGEQVLVAGLPEEDLLVIYSREKLNDMMAGYHDALQQRTSFPS